MSQVLVTESHLTDIADAIRAKLGVETEYKPGEMAAAIISIHANPTLITKTINQNGTYSAEDDNADGYSSVTVNLPPTAPFPLILAGIMNYNSYNNLLKVNGSYGTVASGVNSGGNLTYSNLGTLLQNGSGYSNVNFPLFSGTKSNYGTSQTSASGDCYQFWKNWSGSGNGNVFSQATTPNDGKQRTVSIGWRGGSYTASVTLYDVQFKFDGGSAWKTLSQAMRDGLIVDNIVAAQTYSSSQYYIHDFYKIINGSLTEKRDYPTQMSLFFGLKAGHYISSFTFKSNASSATNYPDGFSWCWFDWEKFTLELADPNA